MFGETYEKAVRGHYKNRFASAIKRHKEDPFLFQEYLMEHFNVMNKLRDDLESEYGTKETQEATDIWVMAKYFSVPMKSSPRDICDAYDQLVSLVIKVKINLHA